MSDRIQITKLEAARRQLRVAIRLLFDEGDPVALHTLIGAASTILSDLVEQLHPNQSWDKFAREANNLTPTEYFRIMRQAQNFLKHARDDTSSTFELDPTDTESLAFWAVMNSGNFGILSMEESVLQLLYLACHAPTLDKDIEPYQKAIEIFGDLRKTPRATRVAIGRRILAEQLTDTSPTT